jgi:hypothetical protein
VNAAGNLNGEHPGPAPESRFVIRWGRRPGGVNAPMDQRVTAPPIALLGGQARKSTAKCSSRRRKPGTFAAADQTIVNKAL